MLRWSIPGAPLVLALAYPAASYSDAVPRGPVGPQFSCGDVTTPASITASDAFLVLRAAVELEEFSLCAADTDGSGLISATDSLLTLRAAVGQSVFLRCPFCCPLCDCSPQTLTIELAGVETCDGCIPRSPATNFGSDSVKISFATDFNDEFEMEAVAECVWEATLPDAITEKLFYGGGVTDCTGSFTTLTDIDVTLRATRVEEGWQVLVGQYARTKEWGDVFTASVVSGSCKQSGSGDNDNEVCDLAGFGNEGDYDTHATGGTASVSIANQEPVCP